MLLPFTLDIVAPPLQKKRTSTPEHAPCVRKNTHGQVQRAVAKMVMGSDQAMTDEQLWRLVQTKESCLGSSQALPCPGDDTSEKSRVLIPIRKLLLV